MLLTWLDVSVGTGRSEIQPHLNGTLHAPSPGSTSLKVPEAVPDSDHRKVPTPITSEECHGNEEEGGQKISGLHLDINHFTNNLKPEIWGSMGLELILKAI